MKPGNLPALLENVPYPLVFWQIKVMEEETMSEFLFTIFSSIVGWMLRGLYAKQDTQKSKPNIRHY